MANPLPDFSCQVQIKFVDTQGMPVITGTTVMVGPGKSTSLGLSGAGMSGRTEFRPIVTLFPIDPCKPSALVSAEVMDMASGVVRVFLPPDPCIGSPAVPVRLGLIDVAQGQVARLIAVNLFPPDPMMLQFRIIDAMGMILSQQTMTVTPGASATLDFTPPPPTTTTLARGAPVGLNSTTNGGPIRAEVSLVNPTSTTMAFLASAEIFDPLSGATTVAWPPVPIRSCGSDGSD